MKGYKKPFTLLIGLVLGTSLYACGIFGGTQDETSGELNKKEELVLEEAIRERIKKPEKDPQEDPDKVESKWGPDSATAVRKYSLYYTYYQQDNYKMAYPYWRWMFFNAPRQSVNLYIRGVNLMEFKMSNASSDEIKDAYLDSLMMVYDKRIKYFNKKGYVLGRKGMNLMQLDPSQARRAYDILKRSIEIEGKESKHYVPYYYMYSAVQLKQSGKISKGEVLEVYNKCMEIVRANLNQGGGSDWQSTKEKIKSLVDPYLSCSDLIAKYQSEFEKNKDNISELKSYKKSLENKGCSASTFYLKLTEHILQKDPTAKTAAALARSWEKKKNTDKAIKFYKKAIELEKDDKKAAQYALSLAKIYQEQKNNLIEARNYAKKAINLNSNYGKAYLILGDIYIAGKDRCGDGFKQAAVHWVAVDQYQKAKEVDPSVKEAAQQRIDSYSQLFPKKEKIFFHNYEEGDTYKVECWINETTTVRPSN